MELKQLKGIIGNELGLGDVIRCLFKDMMDKGDPRLKRIMQVSNSAWYDAKLDKPNDENHAVTMSYKAIFEFVESNSAYRDLYVFIQRARVYYREVSARIYSI